MAEFRLFLFHLQRNKDKGMEDKEKARSILIFWAVEIPKRRLNVIG
ncbi:hypothetical protein HOLDEFILI_03567 [Holdemania filiformis DSM 12042]|uniref:Uncharacterized protein n=1 Tax=Holdemania filiformis DSM 12042 TaxID=545696 RepID=B9YCK6_9FIRM|nr:hypothetical protein HOLDEFILI_03567 [Holdemania filiformis DSM 12042]